MKRLTPLLLLPLLACKPEGVDETGYLRPPDIDTTGEEALEEEESKPLIVVGNPGAVELAGGTLTVTTTSGDVATLEVTDPAGSCAGSGETSSGNGADAGSVAAASLSSPS